MGWRNEQCRGQIDVDLDEDENAARAVFEERRELTVSEIVGDMLTAGRAFYDLVGEWLVRQTLGRLEEFAA